MPKNNNLKPVTLPMKQRFGEQPKTEFVNNLDAQDIKLLQFPSTEMLVNSLVPFARATWSDDPIAFMESMTEAEKLQTVYDCFHFKYLPQSLETINLTFYMNGIDLQTVTHLLRNRIGFTFSAECSADKWWTNKRALVPSAIENSKEVYERYQKIVEACKQLYVDMIDTKKITILDARHILPRCLETYYNMNVNFLSLLNFIKQRIDKQIQPEEDNTLAYRLYLETIKAVPFAINTVDIHAPSKFFISVARSGKSSNFYQPDADSDKFEWNEKDFLYDGTRSDICGTNKDATCHFDEVFKQLEEEINAVTSSQKAWLESKGVKVD